MIRVIDTSALPVVGEMNCPMCQRGDPSCSHNRRARVAAGEPRSVVKESLTTPAPGSTCTASLCEHGIGAVGELWGIVLPGPVELVPGKTIAECISERYPEGVEVLW